MKQLLSNKVINLQMSSFKQTTRYDYNTPEKGSKPDASINTHLKSTTPPTIEPTRFSSSRHNHTNNVYLDVHKTSIPHFGHTSDTEIQSILNAYELKINLLKNYIHSSEDIERQKIVDIFGFQYPCCHQDTANSKIVLKQLSSKVKDLIRENNRLKESRQYVFTSRVDKSQDNALIAENQKLKTMIEEYRRSQSQSSQRLRAQNFQLRRQNDGLKKQISILISQKANSRSPSYTSQDIDFAKKQLTKQMFEFSKNLQTMNKQNMDKINHMEGRVNMISSKLKDYQKQRQIKVESTIRKSFALSQSMVRPAGDMGSHALDREEIPYVRQSVFVSEVRPIKSIPQQVNNIQNSQTSRSQMELREKIAIQEMKIKNLMQENAFLKDQISQLNGKIHGKVERIISLQELLTKLQNDKNNFVQKTRIVNPQLQQQVRIIKETLQSCNISNFQTFFKEFNEIISQRNDMQKHLQGGSVQKSRVKNQEQLSIINKKMNEIIEENKRLLKIIAELETENQNYHEEVISSQIQKLNSIKLGTMPEPSGRQAIQWQYKVKACIENSVNRLQVLQKKIGEKKIVTVTEFQRKSVE